jgi:hypothetical protein
MQFFREKVSAKNKAQQTEDKTQVINKPQS